MRGVPRPTPIEWRELPYSKRLDIVVKQFFIRCTDQPLFQNGKINPNYFAVRKFLDKRPLDEIAKIYDFLYSLADTKYYVDITGLYQAAEYHRKFLIAEEQKAKVKEMNVKQYDEISVEDVLNL